MTESRQVRWQRKKKAEGKCRQCGDPAVPGHTACNACGVKHVLRNRDSQGYQGDNRRGRPGVYKLDKK